MLRCAQWHVACSWRLTMSVNDYGASRFGPGRVFVYEGDTANPAGVSAATQTLAGEDYGVRFFGESLD